MESALEHDRMEVWIPSHHVAESLMGDYHARHQRGCRRFTIKVLNDPVDETGDLGKQPSVVAEEWSERFWYGKDELPMR